MQLLSGLEKEVSKLKRREKSTFCPQQWNITSVLGPLLTEGACSHTEIEHLLHFNMLLLHFQNIRRDTAVGFYQRWSCDLNAVKIALNTKHDWPSLVMDRYSVTEISLKYS